MRLGLETLENRLCPSTYVVNNITDTPVAGQMDLREAITAANNNPEANTILYDWKSFATPQTTTLSGTQLELSNTAGLQTIIGLDVGVTISGNNTSRVFKIDPGVTASISGLTISNGATAVGDENGNGGGVLNQGNLTLQDCTISGNDAFAGYGAGGGIFNDYGSSLSSINCTLSGNKAYSGGGGLYNKESAILTNCTVSSNSTGYYGVGGFQNIGTASLTNTIIAGNSQRDLDNDSGTLSGQNNLIGSQIGQGFSAGVNGNQVGVTTPLLAPLGNYSGPTQTMALLPGSLAIDAGTSTGAPLTDQRGFERGDHVGPVDIGAFESSGFQLTPGNSSNFQTADIGTSFAPLNLSITPNFILEPVNGGVVSFTNHPITGAGAILMTGTATIVAGQAVGNASPNNALGTYTVVASAGGSSVVPFTLTNTGRPFAALSVNTTSDVLFSGPGLLSLREAVSFANFDFSGLASITFDPTFFATPRTITLTGTPLEFFNPGEQETITGPTPGVTINGNKASQVFVIDTGASVALTGLTIANGWSPGDGGALSTSKGSTLILTSCNIINSTSQGDGGGFANSGTATLIDSTFSSNYSKGNGGGFANSGTATVINSTFSSNSCYGFVWGGGGVFNQGGISLTDCTLSSNSSRLEAGGLSNIRTASLVNCTVSGNTADIFGGGVDNAAYGKITLTNSTISGNTVKLNGGGLANSGGSTTLINCTVSLNSVTGISPTGHDGGGLWNNNENSSIDTIRLLNTIVAGNTAHFDNNITPWFVGYDWSKPGISGSNNLIGPGDNSGLVNGVNGNRTGVTAPMLATLGNNGGATQTMALLPGSPAIGGVPANTTGTPTTDQRGLSRNTAIATDIGAYQTQLVASKLVINPQGNGTAGQLIFSPVVQVVDRYGNLVTTFNSLVTLTTLGPSGHPLTETVTAVNGVATFVPRKISKAGNYSMTAAAGNLTTTTSGTFTIYPAAAAKMVLESQPANTTAGKTLAPLAVKLLDAYGNLATNNTSTVTLTLNSGKFSTGSSTATAMVANGIATFKNLTINSAGSYALLATDGSLPSVGSDRFTIAAAAARQLVFGQQPINSIHGVAMNTTVTVLVEDAFGNVVTNNHSSPNITLTLNFGYFNNRLNRITVKVVNGVASYPGLIIMRSHTYILTATNGILPAVTSNPFTVT